MINIIPQSEVRLLKTPLEKDSEHTLNFSTIQDQSAYFLSRTQKTYSDFTYIREQQAIVVPDNYDTIYTCNYLMYKNNGFNNKYFYAFITKMEYVSENSTRIYFEIDSMQTWFFQLNMNQVFIEREHVSDDTIGLHTLPENLETGEYTEEERTSGEVTSFNYFLVPGGTGGSPQIGKVYVVLAVTTPGDFAIGTNNRKYNGVYSGLYYLVFKTEADANSYINYIQTQESEDNIVSVFLIPEYFLPNPTWVQSTGGSYSWYWVDFPSSNDGILLKESYCNKTSYLGNSYIPRNNKLLTWPFKYFIVSNNAGESYTYRYEEFNSNDCRFTIKGAITPGCSIKIMPKNYYGESINTLYSLDAPKLPTCSWLNDTYINWLTSNSVNLGLSLVEDSGKLMAGTFTGDIGGITSGVSSIAHTLGEVYSKSLTPPTAKGGINTGDCLYAEKISFTLHKKVIKEEYARIIDSYFDLYGYQVNTVKTPNITSRRNWNYIKTKLCDFTGDIPQEDLQKIKDIFNNGVTFWHNPENFLNYSVNNDII